MTISDYSIEKSDDGSEDVLLLRGAWRDSLRDVMRSLGISSIRLSRSNGWSDLDVTFLSSLDFLTGIEVYAWDIGDVNPAFANPMLTQVSIAAKLRSDIDFSRLPRLRGCYIHWSPKIKRLEDCTSLTELTVDNFPSEDMVSWRNLSQLTKLSVTSRKLKSLTGIDAFKNLAVFHAANCSYLSDISALKECSGLQVLKFNGCRKIADLPEMQNMNSLEEVYLEDCGKISSLESLQQCANLHTLKFVGDTEIVDGKLDFLLSRKTMRTVWYRNRRHYSHTRENLANLLNTEHAGFTPDVRFSKK